MAKSALRTLTIMEHVASLKRGCTHAEIAQGLSIPKSSLTVLLRDLTSRGYLQLDSATGTFSIGLQVLTLANAYLIGLDIVRLGQESVRWLFSRLGEFSLLCVPSDTEYVLVCSQASPTVAAHSLQVGYRAPLFCAATGRAILAHLPPEQCESILLRSNREAMTPFTKVDLAEIRKEIEQARRTGIAWARGEMFVGISGIGAPIFNHTGQPIAAIGVAMPAMMLNDDRSSEVESLVKEAAMSLSRQFGWQN